MIYTRKATYFYEESVAHEEISTWEKFVNNKDLFGEEEVFYDRGRQTTDIFHDASSGV